MKKVIKEMDKNVVVFQNVSPYRYYGVVLLGNNYKGFITKTEYYEGKYELRCLELLTKGNGWTHIIPSEDFKKFMLECVEGCKEVYEFNTPKELFEWLIS